MKIRTATIDDAGHFVRVFEMASHGLAPYFWQQSANRHQSPGDIALQSMHKKLTSAAPNTALIAEVDGQAAGGIISYDIGGEPEPIAADCDPVIIPLIKLENQALNTHYVNAVAVFADFQGMGIGTALLRRVARNAGPEGLSLIVEDQNMPARRLYQREGYVEKSSTPVIRGGWNTTAREFILMRCDCART